MTLYNLMRWTPEALSEYDLPPEIDRDTLNQMIFMRCGSLHLLWESPPEAILMINTWFRSCYTSFRQLAKTSSLSYNPIHNMDYTVEGTGHSESGAKSGTENQVSAYNADIYSPDSKSDTTSSADADTMSTEHRAGLSGMYSYQDLIDKERATSDWSIYTLIARKFEYAHCVTVY